MAGARAKTEAVKSFEQERQEQKQEGPASKQKKLDEALKDSFPASDPVATLSTSKPGAPDKRKA